MAEKKVYLMLRTHNRRESFFQCLDSIKQQSIMPVVLIISDDPADTYINQVDIKHLIFRPKKKVTRRWIRHHNPYNDYFNQAMSSIPDGNFVIYLDDDDVLLDEDWIKTIIEYNADVLIAKFKMGRNHDYKTVGHAIQRGEIGGSCYAVRSEIARKFKWPKRGGGDFKFIQKVTRLYEPVFIDMIAASVQNNLSRSWRKKG